MKINDPAIGYWIICVFAVFSFCFASEFTIFPQQPKILSNETMQYSQMLHTGTQQDTFYMRGRFGVDFPFAGYNYGADRNIMLGINAAAHINMRPKENMTFPVDNFYAVLAIYFSGSQSSNFSWRFYPVYHVSAHLADGYPSDILKEDVRAVSSEMVRAEAYYKFFDVLEFGAGVGGYYHVCAQKNLRSRADVSFLYTPRPFGMTLPPSSKLQPFVNVRLENVDQNGSNPGADLSAGAFLMRSNRGFGLSLRYFNRLHSSYYFEKYEKGWGAEYLFIY
ncbi:MAG: hypothetical protein FWE57_06585 [Chitinispirillia bacterium]|nr:hypothetical protein [Chitinispirillia bacterium]